ncbi:hypothetical protein PYCCODRAFT_548994 [Trametes coccinea BRFM310]|uniref:Uncharacterized protein n=1 Tax=Trametes coccinea (strain BRFM310) TaxID=1353009 RepID=A0A1Y2IJ17_TRAC3|nr:hypothetical protein PYCCODRAFT_548994 [Trametes coccinea BRFM310]
MRHPNSGVQPNRPRGGAVTVSGEEVLEKRVASTVLRSPERNADTDREMCRHSHAERPLELRPPRRPWPTSAASLTRARKKHRSASPACHAPHRFLRSGVHRGRRAVQDRHDQVPAATAAQILRHTAPSAASTTRDARWAACSIRSQPASMRLPSSNAFQLLTSTGSTFIGTQ